VTVEGLCGLVGMSKQNFYKEKHARQRREVDETLVVDLVQAERRTQPWIGTRKLQVMLRGELEEAGVHLGRDRFFDVLRHHGLLIERRRRSGPRTTDSRHGFRVYGNLLKSLELQGPNEAWVSDLTYIRTQEGFLYLALVMDAWSRKIVGWHVGATLEALGCVAAVRMAMAQLSADARPIHHSDRGTQYCCNDYVALLASRELPISMTEENHCYENGKAERLNGILKEEYGLGAEFARKDEVGLAVRQAVALYNERRPHTALGYRTPSVVHEGGKRLAA
jgi:transposase InsO family protein